MAEDLPDWPASTLLEHAVWWHRKEIVDLLVAAGAPVARPGGTPPQSPLQRALEMGADSLADLLGPGTDLEAAAGLGEVSGVRSRLDEADAGARRRAFRLACLNGRRETARLLCPDGWFDKDALVDALLHGRHLLTWDEGETAWDWARFQLELADPLNVLTLGRASSKRCISQAATPSRSACTAGARVAPDELAAGRGFPLRLPMGSDVTCPGVPRGQPRACP